MWRPLRLGVEVLAAQGRPREPASAAATAASSGKEGKSDHLGVRPAAASARSSRQSALGLAAHQVHLPVAGDERPRGRRVIAGVLVGRRKRRDAGQLVAGEELERGAAAGRDVAEPVGDAGLVRRRDRLAAADQGEAGAGGERVRHRAGAGVERRLLEDAERAVPEQRAGRRRRRRRTRSRVARADVERQEVVGHRVDADRADVGRRVEASRRRRGRSAAATSMPCSPRARRIVGGERRAARARRATP